PRFRAGHLWQSQAELRRSQPGFALRATPRSPVAIPVGTKPLAKADPPRASPPSAVALLRRTGARGILAKASERFIILRFFVRHSIFNVFG
ncbi:MAG: hypothetical protein KKE57_10875, partial [Proteobacteria bacterium]|nr:hypothetical protein [Pseudomonadota bacterium]